MKVKEQLKVTRPGIQPIDNDLITITDFFSKPVLVPSEESCQDKDEDLLNLVKYLRSLNLVFKRIDNVLELNFSGDLKIYTFVLGEHKHFIGRAIHFLSQEIALEQILEPFLTKIFDADLINSIASAINLRENDYMQQKGHGFIDAIFLKIMKETFAG